MLPRNYTAGLARFWLRGILWFLKVVVGLTHEVVGGERLPTGSAIIASKHQSAWDTFIYPLLLRDPTYVHKVELLWIPFFGWYLWRYGTISIDRSGGAGALRKMVAHARRLAETGRQIVIFPEGTRVTPGATRPYRPGVAALYTQLNLPVVPVRLNSGHFWGRRSFAKQPGKITLEVLEAIPSGLDREDFMAELRRRIEGSTDSPKLSGHENLEN